MHGSFHQNSAFTSLPHTGRVQEERLRRRLNKFKEAHSQMSSLLLKLLSSSANFGRMPPAFPLSKYFFSLCGRWQLTVYLCLLTGGAI
jgi:hypothetical protein